MSKSDGRAGAEVLTRLRQRGDAARARYSQSSQQLAESEHRFQDRVRERSEALLELARTLLPQLDRDVIESGFAEVRDVLLGILARQELTERRLHEQIERFRASLSGLEQQRETLDARIAEGAERLAELEADAERWLEAHDTFPELSRRAIQEQSRLERNEERLEEIRREAAEKLPPYEQDEYFRYLWRRQFGTPDYRHRGLIRRIDRWLAHRTDYTRLRTGYEFLARMPALMQVELDRRREEFEQLMAQIDALETEAANTVGLSPVRAAHVEQLESRKELLDRITAEQRGLEIAAREKARFEHDEDRRLDEAQRHLVEHLERTEVVLLEARARETTDSRDDRLVEQLRFLAQEVARCKEEFDRAEAERKTTQRVAMDVQELAIRAERAGFGVPASYFLATYDVDRELDRLTAGEIDVDKAWRELRAAQRLRYGRRVTAPDYLSDPSVVAASRVLAGAMTSILGSARQREVFRGIHRHGRAIRGGRAVWRRLR